MEGERLERRHAWLARRAHAASDRPGGHSTARAVGAFMATSLIVVGLFTAIGIYLQQRRGTKEAIRLSSESARLIGRGSSVPLVTKELLAGDPAALAALDQVVRERVLDDEIVRVKVWQADGRIVYSDQRELIGQRYELAGEDRRGDRLRRQSTERSATSPSRRTAMSSTFGRLLEFYLGVPTPAGSACSSRHTSGSGGSPPVASRLWLAFAPTMLGAIALLWLSQAPLAWSLASRLKRGQQERERLLLRAVEASDVERRKIAADLHDGVVQRLAGTAFSLAAASERLPGASSEETNESLQESTVSVRRAMQELRSLIVEIHPPILANEGLAPALSDLVSPLASRNIVATLDVDAQSIRTPRSRSCCSAERRRRSATSSSIPVRKRLQSRWRRAVGGSA